MGLYRTNAALLVKGDRIERGAEIELADEDVARLDPADISPVSGDVEAPAAAPEPAPDIPLEEMTSAQLKERAKELGLKASGSAADLKERITLHLEGANAPEEDELISE